MYPLSPAKICVLDAVRNDPFCARRLQRILDRTDPESVGFGMYMRKTIYRALIYSTYHRTPV